MCIYIYIYIYMFTKGGLDQRGLGLHLQNMHCSKSCVALRALKRSISCREHSEMSH